MLNHEVEELASDLSSRSDVTPTQAYAYILAHRAPDKMDNKDLAAEMGVTPSTFSQHLSAAKEELEDNNVEALKQFILCTDAGGANSTLRTFVKGVSSNKVTAVLTRYEFTDNNITNKYRLTMMVSNTPNGGYMDDMPEGMHLPLRSTLLTVDGETLADIAEYSDEMLKKEGMSGYDRFSVRHMLRELGAGVEKISLEEIQNS